MKKNYKNGSANFKHGATTRFTKSPEYIVWCGMRDRCRNPNNKRFARYGGRGIKVCERWNDFSLFLVDLGPRPAGTSIERINNNGNYEPGNCRWATCQEQNRNQSQTRTLTVFGETKLLSDWAADIGITRESLRDRLARGMTPEDAVTRQPAGHGYRGHINGRE